MSDENISTREQKPTDRKSSWQLGRRGLTVAGALVLAGVASFGLYERLTAPPPGSVKIPEIDCSYFYVPSPTFKARVIGVPDADDIQVVTHDVFGGTHEVRVRLAEIDAPEYGQPYYDHVKQFITTETLNDDVTIVWRQNNDFSRFGGKCRVVGWVQLPNGDDLSRKLLVNGYAWHFLEYSSHPEEYEQLQNEAKRQRLGLWQEDSPVPPWEYREAKRGWSP